MPFRTFCDNKGCREEMAPVIDKETEKVYCSICDNEVGTVDVFMKRQMVSMGQVRSKKKKSSAYTVKCKHCEKDETPALGPKREILCGDCGEDITKDLGGPFVQMLRSTLSRKQ